MSKCAHKFPFNFFKWWSTGEDRLFYLPVGLATHDKELDRVRRDGSLRAPRVAPFLMAQCNDGRRERRPLEKGAKSRCGDVGKCSPNSTA
jgi:hypothetical protein